MARSRPSSTTVPRDPLDPLPQRPCLAAGQPELSLRAGDIPRDVLRADEIVRAAVIERIGFQQSPVRGHQPFPGMQAAVGLHTPEMRRQRRPARDHGLHLDSRLRQVGAGHLVQHGEVGAVFLAGRKPAAGAEIIAETLHDVLARQGRDRSRVLDPPLDKKAVREAQRLGRKPLRVQRTGKLQLLLSDPAEPRELEQPDTRRRAHQVFTSLLRSPYRCIRRRALQVRQRPPEISSSGASAGPAARSPSPPASGRCFARSPQESGAAPATARGRRARTAGPARRRGSAGERSVRARFLATARLSTTAPNELPESPGPSSTTATVPASFPASKPLGHRAGKLDPALKRMADRANGDGRTSRRARRHRRARLVPMLRMPITTVSGPSPARSAAST